MCYLKYLRIYFIILCLLLVFYPIGYFVLDSNYSFVNNKDINVKKGEVGAYIINLDRSKERYEYVQNNIKLLGIPVERVSAIEGKTLEQTEINTKVDLDLYKQYMGFPQLGMIGCCLSHFKAWQNFLNSNYEFAIIFEDDISFDPLSLKLAIQRLIENSELWDINSFELSHNGTPLVIKSFPDNQKLVVYLTEVTHGGAYIINRKAAIKLLEKALPIKMAIDHYFTRSWEFGIKFTGIEPRLVHQTFGGSVIAQSVRLSGEKVNILVSLKRGVYKLQSYIIRFFYNFKIYLSKFLYST